MQLDEVIRNRRSIRKFSDKVVSSNDIYEIIESARLTPSAKNRQPWNFVVLKGKEKDVFLIDYKKESSKSPDKGDDATGMAMESAPILIACFFLGKSETDLLSIGASMYALTLKATDLGLGSLWVGDSDILKKQKKYENLVGVIALGYPLEFPSPRPRKPIEEISNITAVPSSFSKNEPIFIDEIEEADLSNSDYVFISYSHENVALVRRDIIELKHHGVPLWYDKSLFAGEYWDQKAIDAIKNPRCKVFLFYVSLESLSSSNVFKEFKAAKEKKMSIIPIVIGEDTPTSLISSLLEKGEEEMASAYESFFGKENTLLYISRSKEIGSLTHFESLLSSLLAAGISQEYAAYDHFSYEIEGTRCVITGYNGVSEYISVPEFISGYCVIGIGPSTFAGKESLLGVSLPNCLETIGEGAFRGSAIKEIDIPPSVREIKTACFRDCLNLESVFIPEGISYLAEALFRGCKKLTKFICPSSVIKMEEAVFRNCTSLREVIMSLNLKTMTEGGFYGCTSLIKLVIPISVVGVEIQSFDTSPLLERTQIGRFVFEKGKATIIKG